MTKPAMEQVPSITVPDEALIFMQWGNLDQLTCRQAAILLMIKANPGSTVGAIAHVLNVPKPAVTRDADKLASWSLVHRRLCLSDRRLVELWPGPKKGRRK
jgi:DNA-binding MarR family transcriptional regulator